MYIEKKNIAGETYYYLKLSVRYKDKVRTKTIAYLGKEKLTKEELQKAIAKYTTKAKETKEEALEELKMEIEKKSEFFLTGEQLLKIEKMKEGFNKKLKELDEKTKEEMFNDFLTIYVYNTNAIEGNTFTLRDTDLLLNKGITPQGKSLREIHDHLNAKEAFHFVLEEKPRINHKTIIKIHALLMKNIDNRAGEYRIHNVRVFGARFETSPANYVKVDMDIVLKWYRKHKMQFHPLILAAVFHHKFEKIHPFYDGNGRTGRMLLNIILLENKIPPLILPNAQRKRYYQALEATDKTNLNSIQPQYKEVIKFCYFNLLKTYNTIFGKWGSNP